MQADTKVLPRIAKSKRNLKGIVIKTNKNEAEITMWKMR